ncbi:MAG: hypothetical protein WKG07_32965 [Hymenobacter sp.]
MPEKLRTADGEKARTRRAGAATASTNASTAKKGLRRGAHRVPRRRDLRRRDSPQDSPPIVRELPRPGAARPNQFLDIAKLTPSAH